MTRGQYNTLAAEIVDACFQVHKELGPGLLESVYEFALMKEFELRSIKASNQCQTKLFYKGYDTGKYYLMDILVDNEIVIEIKCADLIPPVYWAQVISYLKLSQKKIRLSCKFSCTKYQRWY